MAHDTATQIFRMGGQPFNVAVLANACLSIFIAKLEARLNHNHIATRDAHQFGKNLGLPAAIRFDRMYRHDSVDSSIGKRNVVQTGGKKPHFVQSIAIKMALGEKQTRQGNIATKDGLRPLLHGPENGRQCGGFANPGIQQSFHG